MKCPICKKFVVPITVNQWIVRCENCGARFGRDYDKQGENRGDRILQTDQS